MEIENASLKAENAELKAQVKNCGKLSKIFFNDSEALFIAFFYRITDRAYRNPWDLSVIKKGKYMCTRFYIEETDPELSAIVNATKRSPLTNQFLLKTAKPLLPSYDIRPTDLAPVIATSCSGKKSIFPMKWGFTIRPNGSPIVNARLETAAEKPSFQESWKRRRCIVPASWYFEWEHLVSSNGKTKVGQKYMIQPVGSTVTWLCGLYRFEADLPVFTILTREPNEELKRLHDRMPLILPKDKIDEWIHPETDPSKLISFTLTEMVIKKAEKSPTLPGFL